MKRWFKFVGILLVVLLFAAACSNNERQINLQTSRKHKQHLKVRKMLN